MSAPINADAFVDNGGKRNLRKCLSVHTSMPAKRLIQGDLLPLVAEGDFFNQSGNAGSWWPATPSLQRKSEGEARKQYEEQIQARELGQRSHRGGR